MRSSKVLSEGLRTQCFSRRIRSKTKAKARCQLSGRTGGGPCRSVLSHKKISANAYFSTLTNHAHETVSDYYPHDVPSNSEMPNCASLPQAHVHENDKVDVPAGGDNNDDDFSHTCRDDYITENLPLPPPLPEPKYSFHRRVLPSSLTQLSSPNGKKLFKEALLSGTAEAFFPLSEQFLNQSDPAYCGVTSLIMILNAFGIDPNVRWKGGWRWYGSEDMILEACCINPERVKRAGILMKEYQSLGRCQGLKVEMKRPTPLVSVEVDGSSSGSEKFYTIDDFRDDIKAMVKNPPIFERDGGGGSATTNSNGDRVGGFIVVSFARGSLGQTGDGHYSPIAAYHESSDRCLILDVARFKYGPYWVSVSDLYESTRPVDVMTNKSRGWFLNYPPKSSMGNNIEGYRGAKAIDEVQRPAEVVPLVGSGSKIEPCPVGKIKVHYCSVGKNDPKKVDVSSKM
jgi:glutathione gamma-glutamylcysteinyltransferase